jgi:hypothetical protein
MASIFKEYFGVPLINVLVIAFALNVVPVNVDPDKDMFDPSHIAIIDK